MTIENHLPFKVIELLEKNGAEVILNDPSL